MTTVFTNGCFDLLHPGHVDLLERARALGDRLVVGLNSDRSVRALKGNGRPLLPQEARAAVLRALRSVDDIIIFDELTPARLIEELQPDVLVKGGDWPVAQIIGAADAQPIAAEFAGRFERERRPYPAIALTTDTSKLTAIGNDYGFEQLFARQVEGLAVPQDVLVAISTSGNSPNVLAAVAAAHRLGCPSIGLTGAKGTRLATLCDVTVMVPSARTSRIQEAHITIGHLWCELADAGTGS